MTICVKAKEVILKRKFKSANTKCENFKPVEWRGPNVRYNTRNNYKKSTMNSKLVAMKLSLKRTKSQMRIKKGIKQVDR